jgi:hypothetical protein
MTEAYLYASEKRPLRLRLRFVCLWNAAYKIKVKQTCAMSVHRIPITLPEGGSKEVGNDNSLASLF